MDLENSESLKNNTSKLYRDTELTAGESSNILNLNGTLSSPHFSFKVSLTHQNLHQFLSSFEKTRSAESQLEFLNNLSKSNPDIVEKYPNLSKFSPSL